MKQPKPTGNGFDEWSFYTSFGRKPLAYACSYLASNINALNRKPSLLMSVLTKTEMIDPEREDNLFSFLAEASGMKEFSVNSLLAELYRVAASQQLVDDEERSILWWGCAANIAYAGGYTVGDLRKAVNSAAVASSQVDADLFGPPKWKGSTFPTIAMEVARYYQEKPGDFILPVLETEKRPDGRVGLFADGQVLCMNFDQLMRSKRRTNGGERDNATSKYLDTSNVEKEHGTES